MEEVRVAKMAKMEAGGVQLHTVVKPYVWQAWLYLHVNEAQ